MNITIVMCVGIGAVFVLVLTALSLRFVGKFFGELAEEEDEEAIAQKIEQKRAAWLHERETLEDNAYCMRDPNRHFKRRDELTRALAKLGPPRPLTKPKGGSS
jgi:Na+-transporting methylmalonyl-CoA/oxaloacetate decarboxylase gamma subunit